MAGPTNTVFSQEWMLSFLAGEADTFEYQGQKYAGYDALEVLFTEEGLTLIMYCNNKEAFRQEFFGYSFEAGCGLWINGVRGLMKIDLVP